MPITSALRTELFRVLELARIAVRRREVEQDTSPGGQRFAPHRDGQGCGAREQLQRSRQAQALFDDVWEQLLVRRQLLAKAGLREYVPQQSGEAGGGRVMAA